MLQKKHPTYLQTILTKHVLDLYAENYITATKEIDSEFPRTWALASRNTCKPTQMRNLTTGPEMAMSGNLSSQMNWPVTIANTQGTARLSARSATLHFPGQTALPSTWSTFKSQTVDMTHTARREFSSFFFYLSHCLSSETRSRPGKHYNHGQVLNWVNLWVNNQENLGIQKIKIKEQVGSVIGSTITPILNPTWIFLDLENTRQVTGSCGYKGINEIPKWRGGKTRIPLNCVLIQYKHEDHLVFSLPSKNHY